MRRHRFLDTNPALLRRFTPKAISGLVGWYDASRIAGLADGAAVAQWDDLSGLGNHATQGIAGNRPTYETGEINGRPVLRFVETNTHHLLADGVAAHFTGSDVPHTVVAVARLTNTAATSRHIYGAGRASTIVPFHQFFSNVSANWSVNRRDDASVGLTVAGGVPNTSPHIFSELFPGTTVTLAVDGQTVIDAAALDVGVTTPLH